MARAKTEPTAAERRLLEREGFRRVDVPGSPREEWVDVGGQRMAWHRALELARRDRDARKAMKKTKGARA